MPSLCAAAARSQPPPTTEAAAAPIAVRQELPPVCDHSLGARHGLYINECAYSAARRAAADRSGAVIVSRYVSAEPRFTIIVGGVARDRVHVVLRVAQLDDDARALHAVVERLGEVAGGGRAT